MRIRSATPPGDVPIALEEVDYAESAAPVVCLKGDRRQAGDIGGRRLDIPRGGQQRADVGEECRPLALALRSVISRAVLDAPMMTSSACERARRSATR